MLVHFVLHIKFNGAYIEAHSGNSELVYTLLHIHFRLQNLSVSVFIKPCLNLKFVIILQTVKEISRLH